MPLRRRQGQGRGAHLKSIASGGKDFGNEVPLCPAAHSEVHNTGRGRFEEKYGVDLRLEAMRLGDEWCERDLNY